MTVRAYYEILRDNLLPYANDIVSEGEDVIFAQDNRPIHTAPITRDSFLGHPKIQVLPRPTGYPDFDPIENVWSINIQEW
ncbi:hypothetical protein J437_LFUL000273 [Ladona fulva]|uniref:Tc1-like transposase DDE domain-containing protein n=1 Tax=Ladona fulva TaxID=123851 RepID=A0A8K0K1V5_LADFU|nr:hypothetical protein J437_LFUL000273 [Ladona fulva]